MPRQSAQWAFVIVLLLSISAKAAAAPVIFYTDIISGPNSGGENNNGAYLSIFGKNFGSDINAVSVTIGGGAVARKIYLGASLGRPDVQQLSVQLGTAAATGAIKVTVGGVDSNTDKTFTVRSGNIYFVALGGNNANAGTFLSPWVTLSTGKSRLFPGDFLYAMDGVTETSPDPLGSDSVIRITTSNNAARAGEANNPITLAGYPGATVIIGDANTGPSTGIRTYLSYWVISGLSIRGTGDAFETNDYINNTISGIRVVNTDQSSGYYTLSIAASPGIVTLGNTLHDSPHSAYYINGSDKADSDGVEIGWNVFRNIQTFGVKAYYAPPNTGPTPRYRQSGVVVHDNIFYNFVRAPILIGGHDWGDQPWITDATIYNNIIYNFSVAPGGGGEGAIRIGNNGGNETLLNVSIFNNTISLDSGAQSAFSIEIDYCVNATVKNNIFSQAIGTYTSGFGSCSITMNHNLYFGGSSMPSQDTAPIQGNPLFVSTSTPDFRLQSASPARDAGLTTAYPSDYDGVVRPQGALFDIGAYEYVAPGTQTDVVAPSAPRGFRVKNHGVRPQ